MDSLEEKVQEKRRYGWKQWIPVYGFYQNIKDYGQGKPCIMEQKILMHVYIICNSLILSGIPFTAWYLLHAYRK